VADGPSLRELYIRACDVCGRNVRRRQLHNVAIIMVSKLRDTAEHNCVGYIKDMINLY